MPLEQSSSLNESSRVETIKHTESTKTIIIELSPTEQLSFTLSTNMIQEINIFNSVNDCPNITIDVSYLNISHNTINAIMKFLQSYDLFIQKHTEMLANFKIDVFNELCKYANDIHTFVRKNGDIRYTYNQQEYLSSAFTIQNANNTTVELPTKEADPDDWENEMRHVLYPHAVYKFTNNEYEYFVQWLNPQFDLTKIYLDPSIHDFAALKDLRELPTTIDTFAQMMFDNLRTLTENEINEQINNYGKIEINPKLNNVYYVRTLPYRYIVPTRRPNTKVACCRLMESDNGILLRMLHNILHFTTVQSIHLQLYAAMVGATKTFNFLHKINQLDMDHDKFVYNQVLNTSFFLAMINGHLEISKFIWSLNNSTTILINPMLPMRSKLPHDIDMYALPPYEDISELPEEGSNEILRYQMMRNLYNTMQYNFEINEHWQLPKDHPHALCGLYYPCSTRLNHHEHVRSHMEGHNHIIEDHLIQYVQNYVFDPIDCTNAPENPNVNVLQVNIAFAHNPFGVLNGILQWNNIPPQIQPQVLPVPPPQPRDQPIINMDHVVDLLHNAPNNPQPETTITEAERQQIEAEIEQLEGEIYALEEVYRMECEMLNKP